MATRTGLIGVALAGVTALAGLTGCATRYARPISDHFNWREFSNAEPPPAGAFWDFLRWQLFEPGLPWPEKVPTESD